MPLYRYEATDRAGKTVIGSMQVANETALSRRLQEMGYQPVIVQSAGRPAAARPAAAAAPPAAPGPRVGHVPPRVLAQFYYELYMSLQAGVPAYQSLHDIGGLTAHATMRQLAAALADTVRAGDRMGDAMARFPTVFPPGDVGLVRAGEMGGFVVDALKEMVSQLEADMEARRACRRYLLYFGLLCALALFVTIPAVAILPGAIAYAWNSSGEVTPGSTVAAGLPGVARAFLFFTLPILLALGAGWWGFRRLSRNPAARARWHRFLLRVPGFGGLAMSRTRAVFAAALRLLYRGGVNPVDAWAAASAAVPNVELGARLAGQTPALNTGGRFSESLRASGVFPPSDIGLLATGERTGKVEETLGRLADFYHREAGAALSQLPVFARYLLLILGALIAGSALGYGAYKYFNTLLNTIN
jgi:type II secretory pathway component PulF